MATDEDFAGEPRRHRRTVRVENQYARVGQRASDGNHVPPILRIADPEGRVHGGLRRSVTVDQFGSRPTVEAMHQFAGKDLAAEKHPAQTFQVREPACVDDRTQQAWDHCRTRHPRREANSTRSWGERCRCGSGTSSRAPASNGRNSSHTETSKLIGVLCSTRSVDVSGNSALHPRQAVDRRLDARSSTPLGRPVEPDV